MKQQWMKQGLALVLAVAAVAAAGCGASKQPAGGSSAAQAASSANQPAPAAGTSGSAAQPAGAAGTAGAGQLTALVAKDLNPETADPVQSTADFRLYEMVYEPLVRYGEGGKIEPGLAESWEISPDGTAYTFHLRKGVKFSDGTDFNADSVLMNAGRWKKDSFSAPLTAVNKLDDHTVELVFESAAYPCLVELTYPRPYRIAGAAAFDASGSFVKMVGTGEWMVERYVPEQEAVMVPNPHYYGARPKLKQIVLKQVSDGQSRLLALQSGEADISISDIPAENRAVVDAAPDLARLEVDGTLSFFLMQNDANPKLQDIHVRRALNLAVDKTTLVNGLLDGTGAAAKGLMTPNTPYVTDENTKGYAYDPDQAKALLQSAGYADQNGDGIVEKDGEPLTFKLTFQTEEYSAWKTVCEYLQAEYAKVGIGIELNQVESGAYYDAIWKTRDFDLIIYRSYEDSWNPHGFIKSMFVTDTDGRGVCWSDAALSEAIRTVLTTVDEGERQTRWSDIFKTVDEQAYTVPLYNPNVEYVYNTRVSGLQKAPTTYEAIEWQLAEKAD